MAYETGTNRQDGKVWDTLRIRQNSVTMRGSSYEIFQSSLALQE
jgi:hypothetical protein